MLERLLGFCGCAAIADSYAGQYLLRHYCLIKMVLQSRLMGDPTD
jgi:hypothetical protein